ncbi:MAG TPA: hypothetical protein DF613_07890 [Lachnospiraceae bacterium]|nr:hypothetical protein [Lachnospiraceae bacterium]
MKTVCYGILSLILTLCILIMPREALDGATQGLLLWFNRVVPAMLPCMMLTSFCMETGLLHRLQNQNIGALQRLTGLSGGGLYAALLGLLCGYPMGAKITADLYRKSLIERREACYLLCFCNQLSPSFLIEYVLFGLYADTEFILPFLLAMYMGILFTQIFFHLHFLRTANQRRAIPFIQAASVEPAVYPAHKKETPKTFTLGESLDASVMNSLEIIAKIGGYMILFSVFAQLLSHFITLFSPWDAVLVTVMELTTGLNALRQSFGTSLSGICLACALCAFGGLSSVMQTASVLKGTDLSVGSYIRAKILQSTVTLLFAFLLFSVLS